MICAKHDWWETENSCPHCASPDPEPAAVTVAETALTEMPDIPDFLVRAPDGTMMHPRVGPSSPFPMQVGDDGPIVDMPDPVENWSDTELYEALNNSELSLVERQPIYMELRRREDRKKSLARIAEMKDKRAAKEDATK